MSRYFEDKTRSLNGVGGLHSLQYKIPPNKQIWGRLEVYTHDAITKRIIDNMHKTLIVPPELKVYFGEQPA